MKKLSLVLAALTFVGSVAAVPQEQIATASSPASTEKPSRAENKFGLGIWLGGADGFVGGYLSYYVVPIIDIEVGGMSLGAGSFSYLVIHGGPKWHFLGGNPGQRWSPYLGVEMQYISAKADVSLGSSTSSGTASAIGVYVPLGIELVAFNGFNFAFEVAYNYVPTIAVEASANGVTTSTEFTGLGGIWAGLKLGWRF